MALATSACAEALTPGGKPRGMQPDLVQSARHVVARPAWPAPCRMRNDRTVSAPRIAEKATIIIQHESGDVAKPPLFPRAAD